MTLNAKSALSGPFYDSAHSTSVETDPIKRNTQQDVPATDAYKPMIVEGRTWWLGMRSMVALKVYEFGLRVGKEVEINGKLWREMNVVLSKHINKRSDVKTWLDEERLLCYAREEDKTVYFRFDEPEITAFPDDPEIYDDFNLEVFYGWQVPFPEGGLEIAIYNFGEQGSNFNVGIADAYDTYSIEDIEPTESCGYTYRKWTVKSVDNQSDNLWHGFAFDEYLEGIGSPHAAVFAPCSAMKAGFVYYLRPELRYVLDKDDNIIYEGVGGEKIWETYASDGIRQISVENRSEEAWYNLQGVEIDRPEQPGVYIKRHTDGSTTKVIIP